MTKRREFLRVASAAAGLSAAVQGAGCRTLGRATRTGRSVMGLTAPPLEEVRVGFIGVGKRGPGAVKRLSRIPKTRVVAVCDVFEERAEKSAQDVVVAGHAKPQTYFGSEEAYKRLCERPDVNLVYVCTPWHFHVPMALYAMQCGKHVCVEVPIAMTVEDGWRLVETAERTRLHCMMLENCCYGEDELFALSLARNGLLGELVHGDCGFHPKMLDAGILAGTGHLWGRRPQARLTKVTPLGDATRLVLKAAVENGYKNDVDSDGQQDSNASGVPQAVAQIALETRLLTRRDTLLSLSGLYGEERTRRAPSADSYPVELIQLAARLPLANPFTLQGTLWAGQNLDAYYGGVLQGINLADGRAVSACGGWVEGVYDLSERWSAALGYGLDNPSDGDLALATSRTRNERIYASLFYLVTANLMIGGEYALLRTEFKEEERVTDNRIQFSGQLSF